MRTVHCFLPSGRYVSEMSIAHRRRAPEITRAEILDKAMEVAAELGAAGFTLDAVASRTSVSKGALLHHFPSKTALLEAIVDAAGKMFTDAVMQEAARDPEPYGRNARAYLRMTVIDPFSPDDVNLGRVVMAACAMEPALAARWRDWARKVTVDDPADPVGADDALMLRLIADGLWLSDLFGLQEISAEQRRSLLSLLTPGATLMETTA